MSRYSYKCVMKITTVLMLLCVTIKRTAGETEDSLEVLPASVEGLEQIALDVCNELFFFDNEPDSTLKEKAVARRKMKIANCIQKFPILGRRISGSFAELRVVCKTKNEITFSVPPSKDQRLVILTPDDPNKLIQNSIVHPMEETNVIIADPLTNYTFWIAKLNSAGIPSTWRRGPLVHVEQTQYDVTIEEPKEYKYKNAKLEVVIKWSFNGETDSCSTLHVTNSCNKSPVGNNLSKTVKGNIKGQVTVANLPLDDSCVFILQSGFNKTYQYRYRTPSCEEFKECPLPPEKVTNVFIEANEASSGSGWDVFIAWSRPKHPPTTYNVTLRADAVHNVVLNGNATFVTLRNVTGEGLYNVTIESVQSNGKVSTTRRAAFPDKMSEASVPTDSPVGVVMVWAWCGVLLTAALVGAAVWWRRRRAKLLKHLYFQGLEDKFPKEFSLETGPESGVEDSWEVRLDRLTLYEVIGEGAFGVVRRGTLAPGGKDVAVKMLKDFPTIEDIRSFRAEMELMKSVGAHPHMVSLVGCSSGRRPLIVAEYCSKGDLLSFLRCSWDIMVSKRNAKYYNNNIEGYDYRNDLFKNNQREHSKLVVNKLYDLQGVCDAELTSLDLLSFCRQIAMGMEFLASNRIVHRDLAARNILVSSDRTLKIADFGLSRDVYQENQYRQKGNGKMPVKWMALESLTHRIYTTQSDVWSFGVVVWEVVTVGAAPYPEVPAARLPRLLRAGYRMPRPNNCSKQLYELMLLCWRARPKERPTFAALHHMLDELLNTACAVEYLSVELDIEDAPPTPKPQRYLKMILRGNRVWTRGERYERYLKAPQSNHYSSPPAPLAKTQAV